jgi:hypothetical protein
MQGTLTSFGKTVDVVAPGAVITNEGSGNLGDQKGNIIRLNSDSPSGTISHEVLHGLGLDDNGYNKGGLLNSPPEPIKSSEVDLTIKFSFEKKNN